MSWSGRVSNSRCSQESTLMQIDRGVKNDETPGWSIDDLLHPAGPVAHQRGAPVVAVRDGLLEQRPQQVVHVHAGRTRCRC